HLGHIGAGQDRPQTLGLDIWLGKGFGKKAQPDPQDRKSLRLLQVFGHSGRSAPQPVSKPKIGQFIWFVSSCKDESFIRQQARIVYDVVVKMMASAAVRAVDLA